MWTTLKAAVANIPVWERDRTNHEFPIISSERYNSQRFENLEAVENVWMSSVSTRFYFAELSLYDVLGRNFVVGCTRRFERLADATIFCFFTSEEEDVRRFVDFSVPGACQSRFLI